MSVNEKHKYEYAVDTTADTAPARVVRMIGFEQNVLEIGSGPGSITKQLFNLNRCKVTALEIDPVAIELVKPFCEAVYPADLNATDWEYVFGDKKFDVVLAADVLEHVYDPLAVLKKMAKLASSSGRVVLSLPHIGHSAVTACLLREDFEYRDWGLLDKTHIRFFGLKNIQVLLQDAGLAITRCEFVVRHPDETEFASKWNELSAKVQTALLSNKYGFVYQVVLEAQLKENAPTKLQLMQQPVVHARLNGGLAGARHQINSIAMRTTRQVAGYLPGSVKAKLKKVASKAGLKF